MKQILEWIGALVLIVIVIAVFLTTGVILSIAFICTAAALGVAVVLSSLLPSTKEKGTREEESGVD